MKRQGGAWIAIICILVVGIFVTNMTKNFVTSRTAEAETSFTAAAVLGAETPAGIEVGRQETALGAPSAGAAGLAKKQAAQIPENRLQTQAAADAGGTPEQAGGEAENGGAGSGEAEMGGAGSEEAGGAAVPAPAGADHEKRYSDLDSAPAKSRSVIQAQPNASETEIADALSGEEAKPAEAPVSLEESSPPAETVKSPLEPGPGAGLSGTEAEEGAVESLDADGFISRLDSIAKQIAQSKGNSEESTAASLYMAAQHEWNLWDNELNQLYSVVLSRMSADEAEKLRQEELEWIKSRDMAADRAAGKASGQTAQRTSYAEAAARKTKERCYEMAEDYRDVLDGASDETGR